MKQSLRVRKSLGTMGILVCARADAIAGDPPFSSQRFYARLCEYGEQCGLVVFVFAAHWLDSWTKSISGYRYDQKLQTWQRGTFPLPDLIYDRSFCSTAAQYSRHRDAICELLRLKPIPFLSRGGPGKWEVAVALRRHNELLPHLPETSQYQGVTPLLKKLVLAGELILKPNDGSKGKGVVKVQVGPDGYRIRGRSRDNELIDRTFQKVKPFQNVLGQLTSGRRYLVQPYLALTSKQGEAFDIRSLMQKNEHGCWMLTGMAVRIGTLGSLTSNLDGGGRAEPLLPFLVAQFGNNKSSWIESELVRLSRAIPLFMEQHFGRFAELGIDFGVDRSGAIWILEVNSKPGRYAFDGWLAAGDLAGKLAVQRPIGYARSLISNT
jgi:hypothetical protein